MSTIWCKGIAGTDKENVTGECFSRVLVDGIEWAVIKWDEEEDPCLYEVNHLLVGKMTWAPMVEVTI